LKTNIEICGDRRPGKPRATVKAEAIMGRLADEDASGRPRVAFFDRVYLTGSEALRWRDSGPVRSLDERLALAG
jgi:hypothetical protein